MKLNMVWFYFLLLIPLISALRRLDDPDLYNVFSGNKPILRMENADYAEAVIGDDTRTRPPPKVKGPGSGTNFEGFVKWLFANQRSRDAPNPPGPMMSDGDSALRLVNDEFRSRTLKKVSTEIKSEWQRFVKWLADLHAKNHPVKGCEDDIEFPVKNSDDGTKQSGGWKDKLWWFFFGGPSRIYKRFKKNGKLFRKADIDQIDLSEIHPGIEQQ